MMTIKPGQPQTEPPALCPTHGTAPQRGCDPCQQWALGVQAGAYFTGGYGPDTQTLNAAEDLLGLHDGTFAARFDAAHPRRSAGMDQR